MIKEENVYRIVICLIVVMIIVSVIRTEMLMKWLTIIITIIILLLMNLIINDAGIVAQNILTEYPSHYIIPGIVINAINIMS